jgi:excisionase family DNA binding protein
MDDANPRPRPLFYTVAEAAAILRCTATTLYRALREDAFPGVRVRTRYVIPARALEELAERAATGGGCVDVAKMVAERRIERELERLGHDHAPRNGPGN